MSDLPNYKPTPAMPEIFSVYRDYLQRRGYKAGSIAAYVHAVEHFTSWLAREGAKLGEAEKAVGRFLNDHLPGCDCPGLLQRHKGTMRSAVTHLLRLMRADGLILADTLRRPSAIQNELADFTNHLHNVCGLAANSGFSPSVGGTISCASVYRRSDQHGGTRTE